MTDEKWECSVRDGRFVEACTSLKMATDNNIPGFSKAKGIFRSELTNMKTHQPSRTYYGVKSKQYPNGLLFNFCPFCGCDIGAPFQKDEGPIRTGGDPMTPDRYRREGADVMRAACAHAAPAAPSAALCPADRPCSQTPAS